MLVEVTVSEEWPRIQKLPPACIAKIRVGVNGASGCSYS